MNLLKNPYIAIAGLIFLLVVIFLLLPNNMSEQTQEQSNETINATLVTSMGNIELELYQSRMPITVGNFVELAEADFYDGVKFHRVIEGFMIQSGDPKTKDDTQIADWGKGGPGYTIEDEFAEGLSNIRGTIAMANSGLPNSGGSQWFINVADNIALDFDKEPAASKHPVFGRVTAGMDVVDAISQVETEGPDRPVDPIVIQDVIIKK